MAHYDDTNGDTDDVFASSSSRYLSLSKSKSHGPRKSPSRQSLSLHARRSANSLRGDDDSANGRHSLAHELAVALMPEPSAGSKLLAEEFGIEYDDGAQGIDDPAATESADVPALSFHDPPATAATSPTSPVFATPHRRPQPEQQDPMAVLAQDLAHTDRFLASLRRLDADHAPAQQPALERIATDVIRRINDTARDREGQVRELLDCEREFRKIAAQVGGTDALGQLDELEDLIQDELKPPPPQQQQPQPSALPQQPLSAIHEDAETTLVNDSSNDWEVDPDPDPASDEDEDVYDDSPAETPIKATFPAPPPLDGPPSAAQTIAQLAHFRTFTTSVAGSLATVSEHTQVNAAAAAEAGRRIRALKNTLGGWRAEWDSAERSRGRIERWEAGVVEGDTPPRKGARRVDGRTLVQEQLHAFELALAEANIKTQAIMAAAA